MSLCENCIYARYRDATWYDPPEWWCAMDDQPYEEFDEEEEITLEVCDSYQEGDPYWDEPDPDYAYEEFRDRMEDERYARMHRGE